MLISEYNSYLEDVVKQARVKEYNAKLTRGFINYTI